MTQVGPLVRFWYRPASGRWYKTRLTSQYEPAIRFSVVTESIERWDKVESKEGLGF
jgi:hypothetical protein